MEKVELLSPFVDEDGLINVRLDEMHPGADDPQYLYQRSQIAQLALDHRNGDDAPLIHYSKDDHRVWASVLSSLADYHKRYAYSEIVAGLHALGLRGDRVAQLRAVSDRLRQLTGFQLSPSVGAAPRDHFFTSLGKSTFFAAQFIRHRSCPYFSPDPDMIHEVVGHGSMLARNSFADMYRMIGRAAQEIRDESALEALSKVFWFTMESGLIWEDAELKVYGGALLSAYGELETFRSAEIRELDYDSMLQQPIELTKYQECLYAARSLDELRKFLEDVLSSLTKSNVGLSGPVA